MATLFRGYEIILQGRDPRDAIFISSRACGVCGGVHSNAAAEAIEMAFGVAPPPMGTIVRNLGQAGEFLYDHPLHLFLLAGPDYSEVIFRATNPEIWERAERTSAPGAEVHGFKTIGEIMTALNPLSGSLYLEALEITRRAREMCVLVWGKYPHPQTIVPGGISTTVTTQTFNEYQTRLFELMDHAKKMVTIWEDLSGFLYEANPAYDQVGARPRFVRQPSELELFEPGQRAFYERWLVERVSGVGVFEAPPEWATPPVWTASPAGESVSAAA
jgi:hydrogenase large subunit